MALHVGSNARPGAMVTARSSHWSTCQRGRREQGSSKSSQPERGCAGLLCAPLHPSYLSGRQWILPVHGVLALRGRLTAEIAQNGSALELIAAGVRCHKIGCITQS